MQSPNWAQAEWGLPWWCIDLEAGTIQVEQSLVLIDNVPTLTAVKTPSSAAKIALDATTVDALRAYRRVQLAERLAWGPAYEDNDLVFSREDGSVLHPGTHMSPEMDRQAADAGAAFIFGGPEALC